MFTHLSKGLAGCCGGLVHVSAGVSKRGGGAAAQALSTMRDFQEKMLEKLSEMTMTPTSQLRFLLDAWLQARSPRRTPRLGAQTLMLEPHPDTLNPLNPLECQCPRSSTRCSLPAALIGLLWALVYSETLSVWQSGDQAPEFRIKVLQRSSVTLWKLPEVGRACCNIGSRLFGRLRGAELQAQPEPGACIQAQSHVGVRACQVVDCRRILKWTYAYGYYRFGEQAASGTAVPRDVLRQRQEFFEFNQARARTW